MALRERAAALMAALDRRLPSVEDFAGQSWSSWVERASACGAEGCDAEECSKNGKKKAEAMTLRKEDMSMFGHCPAHDDFYLVVCSHCGQVVKPQAFERHCERWHGSLAKLVGRLHSSPSASLQRPRHGALTATSRPRHQGTGPPAPPPLTPPTNKHAKTQDGVGHAATEKPLQTVPPTSSSTRQPHPPVSPPDSPAPSLKDPPWLQGSAPPSTEKLLPRKGEPSRPPGSNKSHRKIRKECDLDKHCGVLDPERKKVCTRLLTCNIHSVHQRRKVLGRSKNFDQLVAELKMGSKSRDRVCQPKEGTEEVWAPSPEVPGEQQGVTNCRRHLVNSISFRSKGEGAAEGEKPRLEEGETQSLSPLTHSRLSSEESEGEAQDEYADLHTSPWHPTPVALCSFGSRVLAPGVFAFDRRLQRLRSAFSAMVERHLHLWRKIPQAAELQSQRPALSLRTPSSSCGTVKPTRPPISSPSSGAACGSNDSLAPLINSPRPIHTSPATPPSRSRKGAGRPSKRQWSHGEADLHTGSSSTHKKPAPPHDEEPSSRDRNCVLQERGRTPDPSRTAPSPHGLANGTLSPASKPRHPSSPHSPPSRLLKRAGPVQHPSPDSISRGPGLHIRPESHEHRCPSQKRKGSLPTPPRPHRPPGAPHSGFFWNKEGRSTALSLGLEPKLSTQKPKLHH